MKNSLGNYQIINLDEFVKFSGLKTARSNRFDPPKLIMQFDLDIYNSKSKFLVALRNLGIMQKMWKAIIHDFFA